MAGNIDGNVWYQITESRVNFNSSLQVAGSGLVMAAAGVDANQYWQLLSIGNNQYVFRNKVDGINKQLGTCYAASEMDPAHTQPCMLNSIGDDSQKWAVSTWSDGAYKFVNIGNGSNYNLDCHPGNPMFMSSVIEETPRQPAQHWLIASLATIGDAAYSTTITVRLAPLISLLCFTDSDQDQVSSTSTSASSTAPASTSASATTTASAAPTGTASASPSASPHKSSGLSQGAAAGIGVAVGVCVCLIVAVALFFLVRRRRVARNISELDGRDALPPDSRVDYKRAELPSSLPAEMYQPPAELAAGEHTYSSQEHLQSSQEMSTHISVRNKAPHAPLP